MKKYEIKFISPLTDSTLTTYIKAGTKETAMKKFRMDWNKKYKIETIREMHKTEHNYNSCVN